MVSVVYNSERSGEIVEAFPRQSVCCVGDVVLDTFSYGNVAFNPEGKARRIDNRQQDNRLGGAGNTAANAAALQANVRLYTIVGDDDAGRLIQQLCNNQCGSIIEDLNTGALNIQKTDRKTISLEYHIEGRTNRITRYRIKREDGDETILTSSEGISTEKARISSEGEYKIVTAARINPVNAIILSDYGKGVFKSPVIQSHLIQWANEHGIPCVLDPKQDPNYKSSLDSFKGVSYVCPNNLEAALIAGYDYALPEEVPIGKAEQITRAVADRFEARGVATTWGREGIMAYDAQRDEFRHVALKNPLDDPDVVGAGDTVSATFALALAAGADLFEASHIANTAASIAVRSQGTTAVTQQELRESFTQSVKID